MIIYTKRDWTFKLLFRCYGSAIPRSIPIALLTSAITLCLLRYLGEGLRTTWRNPFAYSVFASTVGFIVVFRAQWAHERYNLGRSNLQAMTARWSDAISLALSFDQHMAPLSSEGLSPTHLQKEAADFQRAAVHLGSLLHAMALLHLRTDWDLDNIIAHDNWTPPPVNDAKNLPTSIYKRNVMYDMFFLRASHARQTAYYRAYPVAVIGDMTTSEIDTITRRAQSDRRSPVRTAGLVSCTNSNGAYIAGPGERVNIVKGWLYTLLAKRRQAGGLAMDAPVLANVWARISEGYLCFEQCRMLVETPFPFPWAQLLTFILVLYMITLPFMVAVCMTRQWLACIVTFISTITHWAMNEVARDLEDPFVYDPNDLPSARLQYLFNERLLQEAAAIVHDEPTFPDYSIPTTSADSIMPSGSSLRGRTRKSRSRKFISRDQNRGTAPNGRMEGAAEDAMQPLLLPDHAPHGEAAV